MHWNKFEETLDVWQRKPHVHTHERLSIFSPLPFQWIRSVVQRIELWFSVQTQTLSNRWMTIKPTALSGLSIDLQILRLAGWTTNHHWWSFDQMQVQSCWFGILHHLWGMLLLNENRVIRCSHSSNSCDALRRTVIGHSSDQRSSIHCSNICLLIRSNFQWIKCITRRRQLIAKTQASKKEGCIVELRYDVNGDVADVEDYILETDQSMNGKQINVCSELLSWLCRPDAFEIVEVARQLDLLCPSRVRLIWRSRRERRRNQFANKSNVVMMIVLKWSRTINSISFPRNHLQVPSFPLSITWVHHTMLLGSRSLIKHFS